MNQALKSEDHQTASLMYATLTQPLIQQLKLKTPEYDKKHLLQGFNAISKNLNIPAVPTIFLHSLLSRREPYPRI